ncbi:DIP1281 family NlpC/P60 protein [Corynebacterium atypicum]|uniref:DIP1281 family NlpC/P60 protein n=1 Tax=Corynebacterium atypicum TaxID=191610 RepID=UPI001F3F9A2D
MAHRQELALLRPWRRRRLPTARVAVASGLSVVMLATGSVHAAPRNPSDSEIADALKAVEQSGSSVSALVGIVSAKESEIAQLELSMGALREEVNKALVNLHDSQASAEQARQAVIQAREELDGVQSSLEAAQQVLNEYSRAAYKRGASAPVSAVSGESTSRDGLDRQTYLRTQAEKQRAAVDELDQLRTSKANNESRLREARNVAEERETAAEEAEAAVREQIESNAGQLAEKNEERTRLIAEHDAAQAKLDEARGLSTALTDQRREYQEFEQREAERKEAEKKAAKAREAAKKAEREKAAKAEQDAAKKEAAKAAEAEKRAVEAANAAAAQIAATQPDHTRVDNPYPSGEAAAPVDIAAVNSPSGQNQGGGSDAAQGVATTAEPGAASPTSPSAAATTPPAAPATAAQQGQGQTQGGATAAATTAQSQAATTSPHGTSATDSTGASDLGPQLKTTEDVTEKVSEAVSGSREEKIETVISRAKVQIGMPYAWGGGDANGPTLGIRDGGVADSYGDYNKVGFDCSGLVLYAFAGVGISLPHYTGDQYQHGTKVALNQIQRGDLLFWGPGASQHVAIYLGDGQMIEAPQSGSTVKISPVRYAGMTEYAVRLI